jgi:hypothetical protein
MAVPSIVFDPLNRELRTVVPAFEDRRPIDVRWSFEAHEPIGPGSTLGAWVFGDGSQESIEAPPECDGFIVDLNDRISFSLLDSWPSQWLLVLG